MFKLTDEQRPIFIIYGICSICAYFSILAILSCVLVEKLTLAQMGYGKIITFVISFSLVIWFLIKNPFLRPRWRWRGTSKIVAACRVVQWICLSAVLILLCPLLIQAILLKLKPEVIAHRIVTVSLLMALVMMIDNFVIARAKEFNKQRKLKMMLKQTNSRR